MPALAEKARRFVVLMLENRSFDHMFGFLAKRDTRINGLRGTESNPDGRDGHVCVANDAGYRDPGVDPGHHFEDVNLQVFGTATPILGASATMGGFVVDYARVVEREKDGKAQPRDIMRCFAPERLPALTALATEFALCDAWHASVPGPTWPNRLFVHAATSDGEANNQIRLYGVRTLVENVLKAKRIARIYAGSIPQSLSFRRLWTKRPFEGMDAFWSAAEQGKLPDYAFIEPDYVGRNADDQHPAHDVASGDRLVADVYEALRGSPQWRETVLVVTYDEHGGIYDHVPPPPAVPPDDKMSKEPPFGFDRLGVRVPTVVVSPWIPRNTVDHTLYDHTTIPATVKKVLGLPSFLTARDAAANTFSHLLSLDAARDDCPAALPRPPVVARAVALDEAPLSDFQRDLVALARLVEAAAPKATRVPGLRARTPAASPTNEASAAEYLTRAVAHLMGPASQRIAPPRRKK